MLKKIPLLLIIMFVTFASVNSNETERAYGEYYLDKMGEVYFRFFTLRREVLDELTHHIGIDKVENGAVYAYANRAEFEHFTQQKIQYEVLKHPGDRVETGIAHSPAELRKEWDKYPSFGAYKEMMAEFQSKYPNMCRIVEVGKTKKGRELLFAVISKNVNKTEPEPRLMFTSTMHGDETTGSVLMLRLVDYLLSNYSTNEQAKMILDNMEIWINPFENPDGTYQNDDNSISRPTRANLNNVDLNRNFPNPASNIGNQQLETKAMMDIAKKHSFVMGGNFHGGVELLNYPYDSWRSSSKPHPDDKWWKYICRYYVDKVHSVSSNYMKGQNNGITHGGDWYVVYGSRQDYVNWYCGDREVTFEVSNTKFLPASQLPKHWDYNKEAILEFIQQGMYGIHGVVTDSGTGKPIEGVKVWIENHDTENTCVYSKKECGDFHRPIYEGTYDVTFTADGYNPVTVKGVKVQNLKTTTLNVKMLDPTGVKTVGTLNHNSIVTEKFSKGISITVPSQFKSPTVEIYNSKGILVKEMKSDMAQSKFMWNYTNSVGATVSNGIYFAMIKSGHEMTRLKLTVSH